MRTPPRAAAAPKPRPGCAGGWILRYENDNTAGDYFFDTRQSRLTFLVDYPNKPNQDHLYWLKRCGPPLRAAGGIGSILHVGMSKPRALFQAKLDPTTTCGDAAHPTSAHEHRAFWAD
jgi:hypothetical protein